MVKSNPFRNVQVRPRDVELYKVNFCEFLKALKRQKFHENLVIG